MISRDIYKIEGYLNYFIENINIECYKISKPENEFFLFGSKFEFNN